jgi:glucosamine--fructose-6-phosphate aminotransferase (isomerizing)
MTSRLEHEIGEQPEVAARLLDRMLPLVGDLRGHLTSRGAEQVLLVARGSSDNAARYAQYLWPARAAVTVALATPSLTTVYGRQPDVSRQAVVAISQSGRSPDVVSVVEQARAAGRPTLAVTNDPSSPLAGAAELVVDLGAGPERSVAATKTYTASLLAIAVLADAWADGADDDDRSRAAREQLRRVPAALGEVVTRASGVEEAAALVAGADRAVSVGRGLNLSTAHETALKITELTGALVAPFSPADLLHGPVAAVGPSVPALLVAPEEAATASVLETVPELRRRGAPVVLLGGPETDDVHRVGLPAAAELPGWLSPLTAVVLGQLVAWRAAGLRGVDVDRPGDLSKVTLTR